MPGEKAQVDWAYFGKREVEGGWRRLWAFIIVLSYCRLFFLRFFYDARLPSFLAGHVEAFSFFGGVARTSLYDNLKSAVLERHGSAIRFHPRLLELADHYGFDPRPVAPYRGNEKGRVERAIRFVRTSFFPLRQTWSLEALNRDALTWCRDRSAQRRWPQDRRRSVEQAYLEERSHLLPLPAEPFLCHERVIAKVRRSPYARFDANRYSVPPDRIQRPLTVLADLERVRIFDRQELVAEHARSWDKQQVIEDDEHLEALWRSKQRARVHQGQDRLLRAVPTSCGPWHSASAIWPPRSPGCLSYSTPLASESCSSPSSRRWRRAPRIPRPCASSSIAGGSSARSSRQANKVPPNLVTTWSRAVTSKLLANATATCSSI